MALPRFIEIDGRRYLWRDLVALRRSQATPQRDIKWGTNLPGREPNSRRS
jgi:hypothetical protein